MGLFIMVILCNTNFDVSGKKKLPVLFPIAVIEEHGPHLPLASDTIWSNYICKEVKKELAKRGREAITGAYETGMQYYMYPELVDTELAKKLESYSLSYEKLGKWMEGGESTVSVVPLGYAGNPKGYESEIIFGHSRG